jgi:hypothetical protein
MIVKIISTALSAVFELAVLYTLIIKTQYYKRLKNLSLSDKQKDNKFSAFLKRNRKQIRTTSIIIFTLIAPCQVALLWHFDYSLFAIIRIYIINALKNTEATYKAYNDANSKFVTAYNNYAKNCKKNAGGVNLLNEWIGWFELYDIVKPLQDEQKKYDKNSKEYEEIEKKIDKALKASKVYYGDKEYTLNQLESLERVSGFSDPGGYDYDFSIEDTDTASKLKALKNEKDRLNAEMEEYIADIYKNKSYY